MIKLFILDKFPGIIDGLTFSLSKYQELEITGSATTLSDAVDFINDTNTDIIIYDPYYWDQWDDINQNISLELRKVFPEKILIALLGEKCKLSFFKAQEAGVSAILTKTDKTLDIVMAAKAVMNGFTLISEKAYTINHHLYSDPKLMMTRSEQKVLKLLAEGFSRKMIAFIIGKSYDSVSSHFKNIAKKFGNDKFKKKRLFVDESCLSN